MPPSLVLGSRLSAREMELVRKEELVDAVALRIFFCSSFKEILQHPSSRVVDDVVVHSSFLLVAVSARAFPCYIHENKMSNGGGVFLFRLSSLLKRATKDPLFFLFF